MRITDLHVHGFGLLADLHLTALGPGLTVVVGPNEAGKSTLHAFLVRTLVGHPRTNDARARARYEPLRGGRHGGSLRLRDEHDGTWRIDRFPGSRPALRVQRPDGTVSTDPQALVPLLGEDLDEDRYLQVHAVDLDALADAGRLQGPALDELLLDAATVGAGRSLRQAIAELTAERDALWTPRGRRPPLNTALKARRDAERRLHAARQRAGSYRAARLARDELAAELARLRTAQQQLATAQRRRDLLGQVHAARIDAAELDDRAAACVVDDRLPPLAGQVGAHAQQLALQRDRRHRLDRAEVALRTAEQQAAAAGLAAGEWPTGPSVRSEVEHPRGGDVLFAPAPRDEPPAADEDELTDRQAALAALRTLLPELEQAAADPGRGRAPGSADPAWLPAALGVLAVVLVAVAAVTAPRAGGLSALPVLLAGLATGVLGWLSARRSPPLRSRAATTPAPPDPSRPGSGTLDLEAQAADAARRLGLALPVTRHDLERAQLGTEQLAVELRRRAQLDGELTRSQQALDDARRHHDQLAAQVAAFDAGTRRLLAAAPLAAGVDPTADLDTQLQQLLAAVSAAGAARTQRQRLRADAERARSRAEELAAQADALEPGTSTPPAGAGAAPADPGTSASTDDPRPDDPRTDGSLEERAAALAERRDELVRRLAEADRALTELGSDDAVATAAAEAARLTALAGELAERWSTLDLAARLLSATLERLEHRHQPTVLDHAGQLLARATGGRWTTVRRVDDALEVDGPTGPVPAAALSRGATEQLYLCLRLALADELGRHGPRLPLLIDDLLVNADPDRADEIAAILAEVAESHQVLVFTCHPATAERVLAAAPQAGVVELTAPPAR